MDNMLALRTGSGINFINFNDIIYCKADGRYTHVFLKNGKSIITARLLKSFENILPGDMFLRIHKSYIINLTCITNYCRSTSAFLVLGTDTELEVSKRRKKQLLEKLDSSFIFV
jgi:two-component system, LytTR family, response regulator